MVLPSHAAMVLLAALSCVSLWCFAEAVHAEPLFEGDELVVFLLLLAYVFQHEIQD